MLQSRVAQLVLYSLCVLFCVGYGVSGVMDLVIADRSAAYVATMGQMGFTVMTVARVAVCLVTAVAFGRMLLKTYREK